MAGKLELCGKLKGKREGSKLVFSAGAISSLNRVFSKAQTRCNNSSSKDVGMRNCGYTVEPTSHSAAHSRIQKAHVILFSIPTFSRFL